MLGSKVLRAFSTPPFLAPLVSLTALAMRLDVGSSPVPPEPSPSLSSPPHAARKAADVARVLPAIRARRREIRCCKVRCQ
ncbi:hypothetical protein D3C83_170910 [compost metagenome]